MIVGSGDGSILPAVDADTDDLVGFLVWCSSTVMLCFVS